MTKQEAWFLAYQSALKTYAGMASHPDTGRSGHERAADLAERDADECPVCVELLRIWVARALAEKALKEMGR